MKELYQLGETPPLGEVPRRMLAQLVRQDRFGEPTRAFKVEQVEVPAELRPDEVLVWVMAAGINYNNVWAALHTPQWITTWSPSFTLRTALPTFHTIPEASLPPMWKGLGSGK